MRHLITASLAILSISFSWAQTSLDSLFTNPPQSAKPHTWWHWINGNISLEGITADLEAMKAIGLGGAQIFNVEVGIPEGDRPFMSQRWKDALAHAFKEAKRLGLEICVHNCAGWSSSGGPWVTPEDSMQVLTWSETEVEGGQQQVLKLNQPESRHGYYRDIIVYAFPKPRNNEFRIENIRQKALFERGDRIDMGTTKVPQDAVIPERLIRSFQVDSEGKIDINLPSGHWIVLRLGHTTTGAVCAPAPVAGRGLEVDKLSRSAMDHYWKGMMSTALELNGTVEKSGLMNALVDSYEVGSQNWTDRLPAEFESKFGYGFLGGKLLACTGRVVQSAESTEAFLFDFRQAICQMFGENYFEYFGELCRKNGLKFSVEGYGNGPFDNVRTGGRADIPMGEFWVGEGAMETTKLAASSGHVYGRPIIGAESFTADDVRGRWLVDPYSVKALGDKVFTKGINRYIFHRYAHQPWIALEPGMTMGPWGMNLDRTITWWDQGSAWMTYISRCQALLQQGQFVADVAAFCGDAEPSDNFFSEELDGYDYDAIDAFALGTMKVNKGTLVLPSGMSYRVLTLPETPWMTLKTLRKLNQLVEAGARIVGPRPTNSPSLADSTSRAEFYQLVNKLWGNSKATQGMNRVGAGIVFFGMKTQEVLLKLGIGKDFESSLRLNWIHRHTPDAEIYFVSNPKKNNVELASLFRVASKPVEIWDPETGTKSRVAFATYGKTQTRVQYTLGPASSCFFVFRNSRSDYKRAQLSVVADETKVAAVPVVKITAARYEATDGAGGIDVKDQVSKLITRGETEIVATNANFGDPTVNHVKHLVIKATLDGVSRTFDIPENGSWQLVEGTSDYDLPSYELKGDVLWPWQLKSATVKTSRGVRRLPIVPTVKWPIRSKWQVSFVKGPKAPQNIEMSDLKSWSESDNPGIKYFSGSAIYSTSIKISGQIRTGWRAVLDLGKVKNFAEIKVNGQSMPILWKAPFRCDITSALRDGNNDLQIKVTNLWPNRLIGDEVEGDPTPWKAGPIAEWPDWIKKGLSKPNDHRATFATWKFYNANSPLLESGLMGPAQILFVKPIRL